MKVNKVIFTCLCQFLLLLMLQEETVVNTAPQQPTFELPVQLLGFPIIILAVRLSNFVKKLAYSLNPRTYMSRTKRELITADDTIIDMDEAEKRLVAELGEHVCIYNRVCLHYAERAKLNKSRSLRTLDWDDILRQYKGSPDRNKEFYLLSVFLGDIVASPKFCNQLAKRGRNCSE
ncbi:uncharacterized protein CBL_13980 [Carabus blaptoides fortunei]